MQFRGIAGVVRGNEIFILVHGFLVRLAAACLGGLAFKGNDLQLLFDPGQVLRLGVEVAWG